MSLDKAEVLAELLKHNTTSAGPHAGRTMSFIRGGRRGLDPGLDIASLAPEQRAQWEQANAQIRELEQGMGWTRIPSCQAPSAAGVRPPERCQPASVPRARLVAFLNRAFRRSEP